MGRAPCCEKIGLKRGKWTAEEDLILINYINTYGHNNWRALPKQAGLLRCGKSCRVRWINYLRPNIKRGNFTMEEKDTIIKLHEMLGNRWSAIAERLPGRTDNEIKNLWHFQLKKKNNNNLNKKKTLHHHPQVETTTKPIPKRQQQEPVMMVNPQTRHHNHHHVKNIIKIESIEEIMPLYDDMSSSINNDNNKFSVDESIDDDGEDNNLALDEDFWSEVLSLDNSNIVTRNIIGEELKFGSSSLCDDGMGSWYDVYAKSEELFPQL